LPTNYVLLLQEKTKFNIINICSLKGQYNTREIRLRAHEAGLLQSRLSQFLQLLLSCVMTAPVRADGAKRSSPDSPLPGYGACQRH
jgi:hypothetical protein